MIEGAKWRRWIYFYLPLGLFVFTLLFPFYWMLVTTFRPDNELYRPWMAPNYTPFWTSHPTLDHIKYLFNETLFGTWMINTLFIALASTAISLFCGLLARPPTLMSSPSFSHIATRASIRSSTVLRGRSTMPIR